MTQSGPSAFQTGGGDMGAKVRAFDWASTPLGPIAGWSVALRVTVDQMLASKFPACLFCGPDLIAIYNDGYATILGTKPQALGQPLRETWKEVWPQLQPIAERALAGESTFIEDYLIRIDRHGRMEDAWFTFNYGPVFDGHGTVIAMLDTVVETTAKVLAERRSQAERTQQQRLLQQMPGFVAVLSGPDHVFDYANDAYLQIAGPRALLGRPVRAAFPELEGQGVFEMLDRVYATGEPLRAHALPVRFAHTPGQRFVDLLCQPIRDATCQTCGIFAGGYDVTERVQAETALRQLNATLEQRVAERTLARERAWQDLAETQDALRQAQKMEAVGQLTGGIAHDFNNLLAAISGALQLMRLRLDQHQTEGLHAYLDMGERSVRRAASLTQRLLAFSRRQTLDPRPTDVNRLVQGMQEMVARTVGPAVQLAVEPAPATWPTRVDASQLENALLNLCINARDAMPEGGRLALATANRTLAAEEAAAQELPAGDYVCLRVTDTGTGMSHDIVQRVFDPFFTTKPLGQGTGLGLSMVYGFVRQSGGQIQVDSEPGRGTTMTLLLPRHLGDAETDDAAHTAEPPGGGTGETLLLIEDEDIVRELLTEVLQDAGYTVLGAADGPAGLRQLQASGPIDLLVTDVGLPGGMNGRQVADAGRLLRPELQVLFITGYAEAATVGNGFMEAGMEVMTKPFDLAALVARVREMLDRRIV
ncbi:ATP-binding protein [Pseudorhodoferax sp. Leaf265]|uniref:ATP-binding protein n=1 Tax=Pseudorhodoferax sp. Leaf265 TaxID=1736315 RepID=UPI0006F8B41C|nr:ATP-binding protein [Pseudorhodoferax sp. Leaf265]KQP19510.1 hypothetical protein ASF45_24365 [Pseudorhodoferax sp. Leaf265]